MVNTSLTIVAKTDATFSYEGTLCANFEAREWGPSARYHNVKLKCREPALAYFASRYVKKDHRYFVTGSGNCGTGSSVAISCMKIGHRFFTPDGMLDGELDAISSTVLADFEMVGFHKVFSILLYDQLLKEGGKQAIPVLSNWILHVNIFRYRESLTKAEKMVLDDPDLYFECKGDMSKFRKSCGRTRDDEDSDSKVSTLV